MHRSKNACTHPQQPSSGLIPWKFDARAFPLARFLMNRRLLRALACGETCREMIQGQVIQNLSVTACMLVPDKSGHNSHGFFVMTTSASNLEEIARA
jgi:hypothetical protein